MKEIAPIVGGGGGGRPDFAEAGGKQPEKIDEMLKASEAVVARLLGLSWQSAQGRCLESQTGSASEVVPEVAPHPD